MRDRWYLCFVGLTTVPLQARSRAEALDVILEDYERRGIALANREVRVRLARRSDAGWLRDMGAGEIADALAVNSTWTAKAHSGAGHRSESVVDCGSDSPQAPK